MCNKKIFQDFEEANKIETTKLQWCCLISSVTGNKYNQNWNKKKVWPRSDIILVRYFFACVCVCVSGEKVMMGRYCCCYSMHQILCAQQKIKLTAAFKTWSIFYKIIWNFIFLWAQVNTHIHTHTRGLSRFCEKKKRKKILKSKISCLCACVCLSAKKTGKLNSQLIIFLSEKLLQIPCEIITYLVFNCRNVALCVGVMSYKKVVENK